MVQLEEFGALGLTDVTLEAIKAKGFETPSPIQKLTIPVLLDDEKTNDIIAQAQTGTGKTAAFGLPILERLRPQKGATQALILVPTRELALQVTEEILSFNAKRKLVISPIYGGASMTEQLRRLGKGIDVVVGTPGRILDHLRRGTLDIKALKYLILDEADEMLNMGFIEDVEEILSNTNDYRRVDIVRVPAQVVTTELSDQIYFEVRDSDKFDALTRIIDVEPEFYGIVFCRTKIGVDEVVNKLTERGYAAEGLHGDVSQVQREKILKRFKKKLANILVATDVAARGIDINNLTHVINYSLPQDTESYVHRIGRTGRAGNTGTAITFISHSEYRQFSSLKREIKVDIKKVARPSAQDVVEKKKTKIKDDLKLAFKNELEESSYPEIRSINVDRKGTARLFISIGKMDGFDARKLTDMLKRECRLPDNKIDDVRVMDSYSFVTVPFSDARQAIRQLNDINRGGRPIAELAKDGDSGENKERSGRDFRKEKRKGARKEDRKTERRDAARKSGGNPRKNDFDWNNVQWDAVNPAAGWGGKAGFDKRAGGKKRGKR